MGFGILFIGYFFLINISYFAYTDIIAAMVMLMGLYQLSSVNKHFRYGAITSSAFAVFALIEFFFAVLEIFAPAEWISAVSSYMSAFRYCLLFVLNIFILRGIESVAKEVDADALKKTAKASVPLASIYLFASVFSLPFLSSVLGKATAFIYFAVLLAIFVYVLSNLVVIYKAYMQICMPGDEERKKKASKSDAMSKFYDSLEQKGKEYAEYKMQKKLQKKEKQKRKK